MVALPAVAGSTAESFLKKVKIALDHESSVLTTTRIRVGDLRGPIIAGSCTTEHRRILRESRGQNVKNTSGGMRPKRNGPVCMNLISNRIKLPHTGLREKKEGKPFRATHRS